MPVTAGEQVRRQSFPSGIGFARPRRRGRDGSTRRQPPASPGQSDDCKASREPMPTCASRACSEQRGDGHA